MARLGRSISSARPRGPPSARSLCLTGPSQGFVNHLGRLSGTPSPPTPLFGASWNVLGVVELPWEHFFRAVLGVF